MDTTPASGQAPVTTAPGKGNRWFVMRDLSRSNAKVPAWEMLRDKHIRHFTPLVWRMMSVGGKRKPRQVPYIQDLVFAYGTRGELDPLVERVRTFQYRYLRHTWREPMTVPDLEMERFIRAVPLLHAGRGHPGDAQPSCLHCGRPAGRLHGHPGHCPRLQAQTPPRGDTHAAGRGRGGGAGIHQTVVIDCLDRRTQGHMLIRHKNIGTYSSCE